MSEIQDNVLKPAKLDQYGKTRPIESILPAEIKEKAREYAKTIEHSYADTREELEEDVAEAWAKGFIFCLQGKVEAIYKDKEETIQKLTDENKKLKVDVEYYTNKVNILLNNKVDVIRKTIDVHNKILGLEE